MKILLSADELREGVDRLAGEIHELYGRQPLTIVGVLTGSMVLVADLIRRLEMPLRVGLVQASSYRGAATQAGDLTLSVDELPDLSERHVLVVDDIFDTGHTLNAIVERLRGQRPASLRTLVLLWKRARQQVSLTPDLVGFEIPDAFVVGYGLDWNDLHRNLPHVAALDDADLAGGAAP